MTPEDVSALIVHVDAFRDAISHAGIFIAFAIVVHAILGKRK
jgi:hypothetical protein